MCNYKPLVKAVALALMTGVAFATPLALPDIITKVTGTYSDTQGNNYVAESNSLTIKIRQIHTTAFDLLEGDKQTLTTSGGNITYTSYTLTNNGNVDETYTLAATNNTSDDLDADSIKIYKDVDNNRQASAGDTEITAPITVAPGESVPLVVAVQLPASISTGGLLKVDVSATDGQSNVLTGAPIELTIITDSSTANTSSWPQSSGGNCHAYRVINTANTWTGANNFAASQTYQTVSGHLATIETATENEFVRNLLDTNNHWLGGSLTSTGYTWLNTDSTSYDNWASAPTGAVGDAIIMANNGLWSTAVPSSQLPYVIEFDTPCQQLDQNVAIDLKSAIDIDCDGQIATTGDTDFGTATIENIDKDQCIMFRSTVSNSSTVNTVKSFVLHQTLDNRFAYVANSTKINDAPVADPNFDTTTRVLSVDTGDIAPSSDKTVIYSVKVVDNQN
jgi:hypothetical protein